MKKSDKLKQSRAAKAEAAQVLLDITAPTAEQTAQAQALIDEVAAFAPMIAAQIAVEDALRDAPAPTRIPAPQLDNSNPAVQFRSPGALIAFRASTVLRPTSFANRQAAELAAYRTGKWLQAALFGNAKAMQYCQENGVFAFGTQQVIYNVQEEGVASTGGALVPDEMERSIIDLREEYGEFRKYAHIVPMGSDYKTQPRRTGGLTAYPVAESAAFTESTKTWDNVSYTAKKWGVLAKYSTELGEDAIINIADDLTQEAAYAFAVAEDGAGINGDGTSTYAGITGTQKKFFDANAAGWAGTVTTATHDLFSEIDADDIDKLVAILPKYARRNAKFYISPVGKTLVFDPILRAAGGNTQGDYASGAPPRYLGYPIVEVAAMPTVQTAQDEIAMFYFGDMSLAVGFGNRRGITVQILNELYAANGQIGVIASERFDINVHDIGNATVAGPLVAYIGETS